MAIEIIGTQKGGIDGGGRHDDFTDIINESGGTTKINKIRPSRIEIREGDNIDSLQVTYEVVKEDGKPYNHIGNKCGGDKGKADDPFILNNNEEISSIKGGFSADAADGSIVIKFLEFQTSQRIISFGKNDPSQNSFTLLGGIFFCSSGWYLNSLGTYQIREIMSISSSTTISTSATSVSPTTSTTTVTQSLSSSIPSVVTQTVTETLSSSTTSTSSSFSNTPSTVTVTSLMSSLSSSSSSTSFSTSYSEFANPPILATTEEKSTSISLLTPINSPLASSKDPIAISSDSSNNPNLVAIIVGVLGSLLLIIILGGCFLIYRKLPTSNRERREPTVLASQQNEQRGTLIENLLQSQRVAT